MRFPPSQGDVVIEFGKGDKDPGHDDHDANNIKLTKKKKRDKHEDDTARQIQAPVRQAKKASVGRAPAAWSC